MRATHKIHYKSAVSILIKIIFNKLSVRAHIIEYQSTKIHGAAMATQRRSAELGFSIFTTLNLVVIKWFRCPHLINSSTFKPFWFWGAYTTTQHAVLSKFFRTHLCQLPFRHKLVITPIVDLLFNWQKMNH